MKWIAAFYKTKSLSGHGRFISVALAVIVPLGWWLIPAFKGQPTTLQWAAINGNVLKYDEPQVADFLESVKSRNGYLCLGTSETTSKKHGNYYDFLDADPDLPHRFTTLGGAGRNTGKHAVWMLQHRETVKGLNITFFINPGYWRSDLHKPNSSYWERYASYKLVRDLAADSAIAPYIRPAAQPWFDQLNPGKKLLLTADHWLRKVRKPFFSDLRYHLWPEKYAGEISTLPANKIGLENYAAASVIDTVEIDPQLNVAHTWKSHLDLHTVYSSSAYRYNELRAFIRLCDALEVDATFIIGPYNRVLLEQKQPESIAAYESIVEQLRTMLIESEADFMDASAVGAQPGTFVDESHHSSYGGWLIYELIKQHIHEKQSR